MLSESLDCSKSTFFSIFPDKILDVFNVLYIYMHKCVYEIF